MGGSFLHRVEADRVVLTLAGGPAGLECAIRTFKDHSQFSLPDTVQLLQKCFSLNQVITIDEPYCDLERYLSFHGFIALIFQNVCSLPHSETVAQFLDSILYLVADILQVRRTQARIENTEASEISPRNRSFDKKLLKYKILLDRIHSENSSDCAQCGIQFARASRLQSHMILSHLGVENWCRLDPGVAQQLLCPHCAVQYYDPHSFTLHQEICPGQNMKENQTYLQSILRLREENQSSSNFCPVCERTLPCRTNFLEHISNHLKGAEQDFSLYVCENEVCTGDSFFLSTREAKLFSQLQAVLPDSWYSCADCEIAELSGSAYSHHLKMYHVGLDVLTVLDSRFELEKCGSCDVEFCSEIHKSVHHTRCEVFEVECLPSLTLDDLENFSALIEKNSERGLKVKKQLSALKEKRHALIAAASVEVVLGVPAEQPEDQSEPLTEVYVRGGSETKRQRKSQPRPRPEHSCHLCGKVYTRPAGLRVHIATFHNKERSYKCEDCGKMFGRLDSLVKHRLTHTQQKNFVCDFCSRAFTQSSNLIKHRKVQHLDLARESYRFQCSQCTGRYYSNKELAKHIRISHDKVKDHRCTVCNLKFGGRALVRRHIMKVHHIAEPAINTHFQKLFDLLENC